MLEEESQFGKRYKIGDGNLYREMKIPEGISNQNIVTAFDTAMFKVTREILNEVLWLQRLSESGVLRGYIFVGHPNFELNGRYLKIYTNGKESRRSADDFCQSLEESLNKQINEIQGNTHDFTKPEYFELPMESFYE
ncbi:MAG: hypothetical protein ABIF10_00920 [Candidatus Woesearchaeota archaeon]